MWLRDDWNLSDEAVFGFAGAGAADNQNASVTTRRLLTERAMLASYASRACDSWFLNSPGENAQHDYVAGTKGDREHSADHSNEQGIVVVLNRLTRRMEINAMCIPGHTYRPAYTLKL